MRVNWRVIATTALVAIVLIGVLGLGRWFLYGSICHGAADARGWSSWGPTSMMTGYSASQEDLGDDGTPRLDSGDTTGSPAGPILSIEQAKDAVQNYLAWLGYQDLEVDELMEFTRNFYAIVAEHETGIGAMELLVDRDTGAVSPEPGPNMMWNDKYGMHSGAMNWMMGDDASGAMRLTPEEAVNTAQRWLDVYRPSMVAESHVDAFYGYYTIHTLRDGEISGMLSVHGDTGQVWYHNWHGDFVQMIGEERT